MSRIPNNIHMVYGLAKDFGWQPYQNSDGKTCHTSTKDAKVHVIQNKRSELVRNLLSSNDWISLECVA